MMLRKVTSALANRSRSSYRYKSHELSSISVGDNLFNSRKSSSSNPNQTFSLVRYQMFSINSQEHLDENDEVPQFLFPRTTSTTFESTHRESTEELYARQLQMEQEQQSEAVKRYTDNYKNLNSMGAATGFRHVQSQLIKWYEPLTLAILSELKKIEFHEPGKDREAYGPILMMLSPEKLAVITLDTTVNSLLRAGNDGCTVTSIASKIGQLVEAEINIDKMRNGKDGVIAWKKTTLMKVLKEKVSKSTMKLRKLRRLIGEDDWTETATVKVGASLLALLLQSTHVDEQCTRPAFIHSIVSQPGGTKRISKFVMNEEVYRSLVDKDDAKEVMVPRYLPMLIPPEPWDNRRKATCYLRLKCKLIKSFSQGQHRAVSQANMDGVIDGLNYVASIPWRINNTVLKVIEECWEKGISVGELPSKYNIQMPKESDAVRIPSKPFNLESEYSKKLMETYPEGDPHWTTPVFDARYYKEMCGHVERKNAELHALRCDMNLKLWVANKFHLDVIYFPYNLDFRGRAYPVPPNLNHLGSDMSRSLLLFDHSMPLGPSGLMWLKLHLANLCGNNKISKDDRVAWIDSKLPQILAVATDPMKDHPDNRWWMQCEEPFQALATCLEIKAALDSGNPETYLCRLPIHQDGSCNGLQHYAALGKDKDGGEAVNLTPSEVPQDVYSKVLQIVKRKLAVDAAIDENDPDLIRRQTGRKARLVVDVVDRKVIKQTVMTSVYGVTKRGASLQVRARLQERIFLDDDASKPNMDHQKELTSAAVYVAHLTLESLQDLFTSAEVIMNWLGTCASIVALNGQVMSWITPLGLPVIQPYRKKAFNSVTTMMQSITLTINDDALPVSPQKQRTAFPPNFVHSLDATHMLMTALKMKEQKLIFAAVHDSYWTHACNVDIMNKNLRECFVELYEQPILESLRDSLELRFPDAVFPPVPDRGQLELRQVLKSTYFFH